MLSSTIETNPRQRSTLPFAPRGRWESFDLLRAVAASCVFVYHYGLFVGRMTNGGSWTAVLGWCAASLGSVGTNLLLLMSGLFVAKSVAQDSFLYRRFLIRRVVRIYPPYLLVLCAAILFALVFPRFAKLNPGDSPLHTLLDQLLLWPGLFPDRPVLTVSWTLSWIMAAYVLLPLPLRVLRSRVRDRYGRIAVLSCLALLWVAAAWITGRTSPRPSYIFGGCAVYELLAVSPRSQAERARLRLLLLGAGAALALRFTIESSPSWGAYASAKTALFTVSGLVGVSLLTVAAFVVQSRYSLDYYGFPLNWIRRLGRIGYSFYMLHNPVTKLFAFSVFPLLAAAEAGAWLYWLCMPVCFLCAAGASAVLFVAAERPIQRFMSSRMP